MEKRFREAARYLGYQAKVIDEQTYNMLVEGFAKLEAIKHSRFVYRLFLINRLGNDTLKIGEIEFNSKNLAKNLSGCEKCAIFAVTLGVEVDMCIRQCAVMDMAKATALQACAAVLVEELCDQVEEELKSQGDLKARFSPGYGDLSLAYQKDVLRVLDASKKIGVTINDEYMMLPLKSVTAIVGIRKGSDD